MKDNRLAIMKEMMLYYADCTRRINHFLKVHAFARYIGMAEGLDEDTLYRLEITAYMHDIGIKPAEEKYQSSAGKYQELEGPAAAKEMLERYDFPKEMIERICYLIGHHHTYKNIEGLDYQILVEADFLVNLFEDRASEHSIRTAREHIFRTSSGTECLDILYLHRR